MNFSHLTLMLQILRIDFARARSFGRIFTIVTAAAEQSLSLKRNLATVFNVGQNEILLDLLNSVLNKDVFIHQFYGFVTFEVEKEEIGFRCFEKVLDSFIILEIFSFYDKFAFKTVKVYEVFSGNIFYVTINGKFGVSSGYVNSINSNLVWIGIV